MDVHGCTVLVTGANRGLGKAFTHAFLDAGAAKVYGGSRDPNAIKDPRIVAVALDVTSAPDIAAAASRCADIDVVINNAGIMLSSPMLAEGSLDAMRREMEVNVYGVVSVTRAFAPALARNGGGAVVNVLSVVSWITVPFNATYCATKHAALAVTDAMRIELASQGTRVLGVHAGFIDTDMAPADRPRTPPRQVAERTIEAIQSGQDLVLADSRAEEVWASLRSGPRR